MRFDVLMWRVDDGFFAWPPFLFLVLASSLGWEKPGGGFFFF